MNNSQHPQFNNLWDKRNNFANEIRRAKRNQIIGQKRKILYQQHLRLLAQEKGTTIETISSADLIKRLQTGPDEKKVLHQIVLKLQSPNENPRMIVEQIFNSGKYCYLIDNLNDGRLIPQTLSVFSVILARSDFEKATFLISKGFLEILIELFGQHLELAGSIANIIGNICVDSDDFCDWILENHCHTLIFDVFGKLYEKFSTNQLKQNPETELGMILWMLTIVCGTQESTLDFTSQYDDVIKFCLQLLDKRIMVSRIIEILYQLAIKNPQKVASAIIPTINDLINEETGSNQYLDNLLWLIALLSPGKIDYDTLFNVVLVGNYQKAKITLRIIEKLGDSSVLSKIMKDEFWWQKFLIKFQANTNETRFALSIIRKHKLYFPCIWRFITDYLDNTYQKNLVNEILVFLRISLSDTGNMSDKGHYIIEGMKRSKIERKLENLMDHGSHNVVEKVQEILFIMEQVAQQLKDNYGLDVEI